MRRIFFVVLVFLLVAPAYAAGKKRVGNQCPFGYWIQNNVVRDADFDLRGEGPVTSQCVRTAVIIMDLQPKPTFRYVGRSGVAEWLAASSSIGEDCDDSNRNVYQFILGGTDTDHDGYVKEDKTALFMVGGPVAFGERFYFTNSVGTPVILAEDKILGFGDKDDGNPAEH